MITCRYCGKIIAKGTERFDTLKRRLKSYDMYWFCKNDVCLKKYIENEESLVEDKLGEGKNEN